MPIRDFLYPALLTLLSPCCLDDAGYPKSLAVGARYAEGSSIASNLWTINNSGWQTQANRGRRRLIPFSLGTSVR